MTVLRELWYCHVAVLSSTPAAPSNPPRFPCAYPFLSDFRGQFWRSSGTQNGSCGISSESSRRPLSNDIKFARIGVRTRELWLPEVGVSELFSCTLPVKIPIKRGMLSANREFHDVAGVIIFPTHPGSRINLLRAGKTLRAKAAVREKKCVLLPARFFSNLVPVPDSRESELGLVRYGPASRVHRGVFGPFEGSFPIRIPADPDKFLAIREFHVVHGCVFFPMCPGSQINLLRVRKTLCASVATSALHRGELGFARYDPANGGRRNVPYAKGSRFACQSFRSPNGHSRAWRRSVGMRKDDSGLEMVKRGSWELAHLRGASHSHFFRFLFFALWTPLRPSFTLLLISCYPGLRLTRRLRLRAPRMSDRGSGSGGHRRSDRLAKGKSVAYAPESSPDTDDEYDAMEDVRTRLDASLARNLQAELDAEAAGLAPSAARAPPRPGVVIGRSARPSETTRPSPQPGVTTGPSDAPSAAPRRPHTRSTGIPPSRLKRQRTEGIPDSAGTIPEDYVAPGFRYPPHGGIRPRYPVAVEISDTPLLTNLLAHPSSLVRRCQEPPDSAGRGGWSDFCRLLEASRPEYREFLIELGFGPFLSIPYVSVYHLS
uniref:Uncharacterized protein n=1 Tax=Fagus sylvatica TaxID=28930 RepID=A0A2N9GED5_FAGSY